MKKTLFLATALLGIVQAQAQNPFVRKNPAHARERALLKSILKAQTPSTAQKPTGTHQRVVAQALSGEVGGDSTVYKYAGPKGSSFDFDGLEYDYPSEFSYNYSPLPHFPGQANPMNLLADTIISYTNSGVRTARAFYRPDNKLDSVIAMDDNGSSMDFAFSNYNLFNAQGALLRSTIIEGAPTDTSSIRRFVYNGASTQVQSDTIFVPLGGINVPVQATTYHYNTGKLDSVTTWIYTGTGLIIGNRTKMTYNTSGKLVTMKTYNYSSSTPVLDYTDSLGYTAGADYHTYLQEESYDSDGLINDGFREVKYVGSSGLPDSVKIFQKDDALSEYEYAGMLTATYNSYDNPETFVVTTPATGPVPIGIFHFYYELWDDGLSIKPVAENQEFDIYPNPFTNNISIDWKGKQQSNVTVCLTNMAGQEVFKSSVRLNSGTNSISVPGLGSGNYILIIRDSNGKSWSNKMVKK